jgi:MFS superfamily sulfate permease-like transporter
VAVLLFFGADLLRSLPNSALAAVVISSAIGLFELGDLGRIFRVQQWEFWLSVVCFLGVALFGAIPGIGLAIVIAVIEFLWDGWRPHYAVLGRVEGIRGYHDIKRYPQARLVPGLILFRWDAPLFFANAALFREEVLNQVANAPTPAKRIIVTSEPVTSIDITSADMLVDLKKELEEKQVQLHFAEMKDPVKDKLKRFELFPVLGSDIFYATIGAAVDRYLEEFKVDWKP